MIKIMLKKIGISLGVIIVVPLIFLLMQSIASGGVLIIYIRVHHLNIQKVGKEALTQIVENRAYYAAAIGDFISVLVLMLIYLIPKEGLIKRCRFKKFDAKKIPAIILFVVGFSFLSIVFIKFTQGDVKSYLSVEKYMAASASTVLGGILLVLVIPIFEEMIFRGAIFGTLRKQMPWIVALIIQAIIFSLMHGNLIQSIYTFPLGIILGLIFVYAGSMFGDIIGHMTFNLFGVYLIPILAFLFYNCIIYLIVGLLLIVISVIYNKKIVLNQNKRS